MHLLRLEHLVYLTLSGNHTFARLLDMQTRNRGSTPEGLKYFSMGRRMSGDMNTALGNCVIMLVMIATACNSLVPRRWDCLIDGDDALVFIDAKDYTVLAGHLAADFLRFGMTLKVEAPVYQIHCVEWCQSKPIFAACLDGHHRWKMVRNPRKILRGALFSSKLNVFNLRASYLVTVGLCELALNHGVPILESFARWLVRAGGSARLSPNYQHSGSFQRVSRELRTLRRTLDSLRDLQCVPISVETRSMFAQQWALPVDVQLFLESYFDHSPAPRHWFERHIAEVSARLPECCDDYDWLVSSYI